MAINFQQVCGCSDWPVFRPGIPGPPLPRAPGFTGPFQAPRTMPPTRTDSPPEDDRKASDSPSNGVRSKFPETWIWTDAVTGYVILVKTDW